MKTVLRVEIVVDCVKLNDIIELILSSGAEGYTVIPQVHGAGSRGIRSGDELTGAFTNVMILVACTEPVWESMATKLRPVLKRYGGLCLVSEAKSLLH